MTDANERKLFLREVRELPFYGTNYIELSNTPSDIHSTMKNLNALSSIHDMESSNYQNICINLNINLDVTDKKY
jgi:hypothetical protein